MEDSTDNVKVVFGLNARTVQLLEKILMITLGHSSKTSLSNLVVSFLIFYNSVNTLGPVTGLTTLLPLSV